MSVLTHKLMTFAEYMDQSLYGPGGYYASGQAESGRKGDYFTAPDVGPAFGQLLAQIFQGWQKKLGFSPFHLVEAGPGEGALAQSLKNTLPTNFHYTAVERSPARQQKLRATGFKVAASLNDLSPAPIAGCIFGNELLDAFPVHRVRMHNGELQEAYVEDGRLTWERPSTSKLAAYFERTGITLPDDYETEVNLAMAEWFQSAAQALTKGLVLLVDYGHPAHEYYAPERNRGTLRTFSKHRVGSDALAAPGLTDLTADVDFTSAALDARAAGLTPLAFMELGSFLIEGARSLAEAPRGLQYVIHPDGLGSAFHVLILGKGVSLSEKDFPNNRMKRLGLAPLTPPSPARGEGVVTKGD